jgi:hypothetical protein
MSHFFKKVKNKGDYSGLSGSSVVVVKNVSGGPFEVDSDGRTLAKNTMAAIDESCPICAKGISDGKLVVLHRPAKPSSPKPKQKQVLEETDEVQQTVASAEDVESVQ